MSNHAEDFKTVFATTVLAAQLERNSVEEIFACDVLG